ncbi:MAG: TIGR04283 family arsenosugar biosynthesis glycosyltransferase [Candidatus Methylomirabilales bacterium]
MTTPDHNKMLSIIIPAVNEAHYLRRLLPDLSKKFPGAEVIVVDGGSIDGSPQAVQQFPFARFFVSPRGRARQMNAGAHEARGEILLFLHADTSLPNGALEAIRAAMRDPQIVGGRFEVELDSNRPIFRTIAYCMNLLRSRPDLIATGDQAVFVRRKIFTEMEGYPEIPLMEDVEFIKNLKRRGGIAYLRLTATTSARKWEREGVLQTALLMLAIRFLHFIRVSPVRLHQLYYGYTLPSK